MPIKQSLHHQIQRGKIIFSEADISLQFIHFPLSQLCCVTFCCAPCSLHTLITCRVLLCTAFTFTFRQIRFQNFDPLCSLRNQFCFFTLADLTSAKNGLLEEGGFGKYSCLQVPGRDYLDSVCCFYFVVHTLPTFLIPHIITWKSCFVALVRLKS